LSFWLTARLRLAVPAFGWALRAPLTRGDDRLPVLVDDDVTRDAERPHKPPIVSCGMPMRQVVMRLRGRALTAPVAGEVRIEV
jgi:hypothetical protein